MKTRTLFLFGGCSGSFAAPSENRSVFDASAQWHVRRVPFRRELYGSRTTSFFLRHGDDFIIVDQGLGVEPISEFIVDMLQAEQRSSATIHCLQTHFHEDHLDGLRANSLFFRRGVTLKFYSPQLVGTSDVQNGCDGIANDWEIGDARGQACPPTPTMENVLLKQFCESYWPVTLKKLDEFGVSRVHCSFRPGDTLQVGSLTVRTLPLTHPGGCTGFRLEVPGNGVVVIATDYEPAADPDPQVVEFFDSATLLIVDMQYRDDEYIGDRAIGGREENRMPRIGWGHGTPGRVLPLLLKCARPPQRVRISHHDPKRPDSDLQLFCDETDQALARWNSGRHIDYSFAREGDIIWL